MVLVAGYLLLTPFTLTHSQAVFAYGSDRVVQVAV